MYSRTVGGYCGFALTFEGRLKEGTPEYLVK